VDNSEDKDEQNKKIFSIATQLKEVIMENIKDGPDILTPQITAMLFSGVGVFYSTMMETFIPNRMERTKFLMNITNSIIKTWEEKE
jgi:hypothetical protein